MTTASNSRGLLTLEYAQPTVVRHGRSNSSVHTPGRWFDTAVVFTLVITAVGYFTA